MSKHLKRSCLIVALATLLSSGAVYAKTGTTTKTVTYSNIQVKYNGITKSLPGDYEPFAINGTTYLPLRALATAMGCDVGYDPTAKTVIITQTVTDSSASSAQLQQAQIQIQRLQQDLAIAQNELTKYKNATTTITNPATTTPSTSNQTYNEAVEYIEDNYGDYKDISWDIDIDVLANGLDIELAFDGSSNYKKYADLSSSTIENFAKNVCKNLATYYQNTKITGTIVDNQNDVDRADFTYSNSGRWTYSSVKDDYDDFANDLEDDYDEINSIEYYTNTAKTETSTFSVDIESITIEEGSSKLLTTVEIYLSSSDRNKWNAMTSDGEETVYKELKDIKNEIEDEFDESVSVTIEDSNTGDTAFSGSSFNEID